MVGPGVRNLVDKLTQNWEAKIKGQGQAEKLSGFLLV
jgi:hypothetical protein